MESLDRKEYAENAMRFARSSLFVGEERISTRADVELPVSIKFDEIHEARAQAENLSARGIFMVVAQRLLFGSHFELVFCLPRQVIGTGDVWLRCRAEIVRLENRPDGRFGVAAAFRSREVFQL